MYFIIKEAIFLHGVYGPYPTIEEAEMVFKKAYEGAGNNLDNE